MFKHYIRTDDNDIIIYAYSTAFESYTEGDIELTEENKGPIYDGLKTVLGGRHFQPAVREPHGAYKWEWNGSAVVNRTDNDKYPINDVRNEKKYEIKQTAFHALSLTDWKVIRHRDQLDNGEETTLTSGEYVNLLEERKTIRDNSDTFEGDVDGISVRDDIYTYTWNIMSGVV